MKVWRKTKIKTDIVVVGDQITVRLDRKYKATAIQEVDGGMLFLFDDCLSERMAMNKNGKTTGGYLESDLRRALKKLEALIPEKLRRFMRRDENGDFLYLLDRKQVVGHCEDSAEPKSRIKWLRDRRNRMARVHGGEKYSYWWLSDVASIKDFACVDHFGIVTGYDAYRPLGVRPAFILNSSAEETNYEKVRHMTKDEIAEFMAGGIPYNCANYCDKDGNNCGWTCQHNEGKDKEFALKWLSDVYRDV